MSSPFPKRPDFLTDGFDWKRRGYAVSLIGEAPVVALESGNPWIVLVAVLELAKRGEHEHIARLRGCAADPSVSPTFGAACLDVLADAGTPDDVRFLEGLIRNGPDEVRLEAIQAAQWCGELWLVESMLEAWHAQTRVADRAAIESSISNMLEPRTDSGELELFGGGAENPRYREIVRRRLDQLLEKYGDQGLVVFHGVPFSAAAQALELRTTLAAADPKKGTHRSPALAFRRKFEPYSGYDCSAFYDERGVLQADAVIEVIDRFIEDPAGTSQVPGKRYFAGHPIEIKAPS